MFMTIECAHFTEYNFYMINISWAQTKGVAKLCTVLAKVGKTASNALTPLLFWYLL